MADRVFTAYVIVRNPDDLQTHTFEPGDAVPDWCIDHVGDHVSEGVSTSRQTAKDDDETRTVTNDDGSTTEFVTPESDAAELAEEGEAPGENMNAVDEEESYEDWTKAELKEEAKGRELEGYSSLTKEELIALLREDDEAAE